MQRHFLSTPKNCRKDCLNQIERTSSKLFTLVPPGFMPYMRRWYFLCTFATIVCYSTPVFPLDYALLLRERANSLMGLKMASRQATKTQSWSSYMSCALQLKRQSWQSYSGMLLLLLATNLYSRTRSNRPTSWRQTQRYTACNCRSIMPLLSRSWLYSVIMRHFLKVFISRNFRKSSTCYNASNFLSASAYQSIRISACSCGSVMRTHSLERVTLRQFEAVDQCLQSMYRQPAEGAAFLRSFQFEIVRACWGEEDETGGRDYFFPISSGGCKDVLMDYALVPRVNFLPLVAPVRSWSISCLIFTFISLSPLGAIPFSLEAERALSNILMEADLVGRCRLGLGESFLSGARSRSQRLPMELREFTRVIRRFLVETSILLQHYIF